LLERRHMTRYDFGAIAEIVDLDSREDVIVVTRDLSLSGCFVKTRATFPPGTEVRVRITYAGSDFAAIGSVTENITREGMGIEFVEIEPQHQATLEAWLGVSARNADGYVAPKPIRLKNRLSRQERPRPLPSQGPAPKTDRPAPIAHQFLESARNFWKSRDTSEQ
jgi:PilZ domain-containing protein